MTLKTLGAMFGVPTRGRRWEPIEIPNMRRADLARLFAACGFTVGAEVGVMEGKFSEVLCRGVPDLHLYCVDAWRAHEGYGYFTDARLEKSRRKAVARLAPFNVGFVRQFSVEAAKGFQDESLDFVFIDADHEFASVVADLAAWVPKVRPGGVVSGHDYFRERPGRHVHVVDAVQGFTRAYYVAPWYVVGASKKAGGIRDERRSWMWVKA